MPSPPAVVTASSADFVVVVEVDPTLDVDPDPLTPCPRGPAVLVPFDRGELLIGRKDEVRDVHPEIPLTDPGTSRRHAKLVRAQDGTLLFVDLASTNGSKLNGLEVKPGSRSPLHVGDEITVGRWTRIKVTVRA
jgi:pSer/pThr/pTyr-binding forkhead associated (FHA) protein